jgi:transcriptional regulator with XRE-family HTH domain
MISNFEIAIISNVKNIRLSKGFTCQDIANILDTSVNFINNVESEKSDDKYNINHLLKISYLFDCDICEFFPRNFSIKNESFQKDLQFQKEIIFKTRKIIP